MLAINPYKLRGPKGHLTNAWVNSNPYLHSSTPQGPNVSAMTLYDRAYFVLVNRQVFYQDVNNA